MLPRIAEYQKQVEMSKIQWEDLVHKTIARSFKDLKMEE